MDGEDAPRLDIGPRNHCCNQKRPKRAQQFLTSRDFLTHIRDAVLGFIFFLVRNPETKFPLWQRCQRTQVAVVDDEDNNFTNHHRKRYNTRSKYFCSPPVNAVDASVGQGEDGPKSSKRQESVAAPDVLTDEEFALVPVGEVPEAVMGQLWGTVLGIVVAACIRLGRRNRRWYRFAMVVEGIGRPLVCRGLCSDASFFVACKLRYQTLY